MPDDAARNTPQTNGTQTHLTLLRIRDTDRTGASALPGLVDDSPEQRTAVHEGTLDPSHRLVAKSARMGATAPGSIVGTGCQLHRYAVVPVQTCWTAVRQILDGLSRRHAGRKLPVSGGFRFDNNQVYAVVGTLGTATGMPPTLA